MVHRREGPGRRKRSAGCLYIQFARAPQAGRVKTRLQSALGPQGACELHCELLNHTAGQLYCLGSTPRELWVSGSAGSCGSHWLSRLAAHYGMTLRRQRGADLGERMLHALRDGLARYRRVVLVGSDCPGLDRGYLQKAAALLGEHDMIWGPARDGGYVLVGASRADASCFRRIDWGSSVVLSQTLARARVANLKHALLDYREDIDLPQDLALWRAVRGWGGDAASADTERLVAEGRRLCACSH